MVELKKLLPSKGDGTSAEIDMSPSTEGENPYLGQRYVFQQTFADQAKGKRNWQVIAFWLAGLLALTIFGLVTLATTKQFQLHVVEVDKLGQTRSLTEVNTLSDPSPVALRSTITRFFRNIRAVYSDPVAQTHATHTAFAFATEDTQDWLNNFFSDPEKDPRVLSEDFSRTVEVNAITKLPDSDTYRVQWTETKHFDQRQEKSVWEAFPTITQAPPADEAEAKVNPYGTRIALDSWSRISQTR